jgi:hypothetical protein
MATIVAGVQICASCANVKPAFEFYYNRHRGTHFKRCKQCERERSLARYRSNLPVTAQGRQPARLVVPDVTSANTTERGLGWMHQQQRRRLLDRHVDGSTCFWCGNAMYLDASLNWDHNGLEADHSLPRSHGGMLADRLLHKRCNRERGDGERDDVRPAVTGAHSPTPDAGLPAWIEA